MIHLADPGRAKALLARAFTQDSFSPPSWEFSKVLIQILLRRQQPEIEHLVLVLSRVERFVPARMQLARTYIENGQAEQGAEMVKTIKLFAPR